LTFILLSLLYLETMVFLLNVAHHYWSIMSISFIVCIGFDRIRPAITNYFSNIAGNRQGLAGGLNSTFTSMGNFAGPLVAGTLYDVNLEFPLYMSVTVMLLGIVIIMVEKTIRKSRKLKQS
ncbi:MFS transporter, partial [Staphylococcus nepalensis]